MCETPDSDVLAEGSSVSGGNLQLTLTVTAVVLAIDHLTKWWAQSRLDPGICTPESCVSIFGSSVRFHLIYNTGAAFSAGEGLGWIIGPLALVMAGYLFFLARRTSDRISLFALGLVAGGALGNLIDRVIRSSDGFMSGGVVDFIDFQFWPVFNVADIGVVCGVLLLFFRQIGGSSAPEAASQIANEADG